MRSLFRVFSHIILKVTSIYVVASIVGILALDKLFGGYEFYLGMLVFIAPLLTWALTFMLVPKNLDWIMALPISKRNVLVLHYLTSVFTSTVIFAASVFVLIVLALLKTDQKLGVGHLAKAAPALIPEAQLGMYLAGIDIYGWMTALLMISFFHALSMSISRPATTKRFYMNLWNHANPVWRWTIRTSWLGAIALAAVGREFFLAPFGIFVIATISFLFLTTLNTSNALGIARTQRSRWLTISAVVAGVQIVFLFLHAMHGVGSPSFDRRVASVMFLGPFSGGMAKRDLARLLEADIKQDRVEELGELYKRSFSGGRKIRVSQDGDLNFLRAIESKHAFADVVSTVRLFDPIDLSFADVKALLTKLQPLMTECRCEYNGYDLLNAAIDVQGARELMSSPHDVAVQFGLLWTRYHTDLPELAEFAQRTIETGLPRYNDKTKLAALLTLSILKGRRYTFSDWIKGRGLRAVSSESSRLDCAGWKLPPVAELTAAQSARLNACIRRRADPAQIAEIEAAGWMEPPFDSKTRATIRKVFHSK